MGGSPGQNDARDNVVLTYQPTPSTNRTTNTCFQPDTTGVSRAEKPRKRPHRGDKKRQLNKTPAQSLISRAGATFGTRPSPPIRRCNRPFAGRNRPCRKRQTMNRQSAAMNLVCDRIWSYSFGRRHSLQHWSAVIKDGCVGSPRFGSSPATLWNAFNQKVM